LIEVIALDDSHAASRDVLFLVDRADKDEVRQTQLFLERDPHAEGVTFARAACEEEKNCNCSNP